MDSARKTKGWSSAIDSDGSAAQPAPTMATYMHTLPGFGYPVWAPAQPAVQKSTHKIAFYNVGWAAPSKKHTAARLAREVSDIIAQRNVDAIGISEVFGQRENFKDWREAIMSELLAHLNQGSAEQPAWDGRTDVHYIFIWDSTSLHLVDYEVVSCGVDNELTRSG